MRGQDGSISRNPRERRRLCCRPRAVGRPRPRSSTGAKCGVFYRPVNRAGGLPLSRSAAPCRMERLRQAPFGRPQQMLEYLGRYTHRVAIANSRLLDCENARVRFRWKDYRAHNKSKVMTFDADEFIRRFLLHVLPKGFRRIRHFGFLANACRSAKLPAIRAALHAPEPAPTLETCRLSRALRNPHRPSHRYLPHLRRLHGRDWPLAAFARRRAAPRCDTS
jgi:Putative transposase